MVCVKSADGTVLMKSSGSGPPDQLNRCKDARLGHSGQFQHLWIQSLKKLSQICNGLSVLPLRVVAFQSLHGAARQCHAAAAARIWCHATGAACIWPLRLCFRSGPAFLLCRPAVHTGLAACIKGRTRDQSRGRGSHWSSFKGLHVTGGVANLREYFLNDYKGGGAFEHEAYEHDAAEWCWIHKRSGIKVWQDALDLTQSGGTGEVQCLFHYTTSLGFRNITAPSKKAVEVFASLLTEGPDANAWWGQGVYTVQKAPHEWADVAMLVDNNYRNMHALKTQTHGRKAADQEYRSRVAYCIPILVNAAMTCDVSMQQTPEMREKDKPPGVNLKGKLLNEPGRPERQCIVIRVQREEQVGHASAVLLDTKLGSFLGLGAWACHVLQTVNTGGRPEFQLLRDRLRCRADATAERLGSEHDKALLALSRLARILEARGAFAEAVPLRRRVLKARERQLGPEHRDTLACMNNLAFVLKRMERFSEAEALYHRDLAGSEALRGANHPVPETLTSMNNLAMLRSNQGRLDEAEKLHRSALAGREAQLGANHLDTLSSINNLAVILKQQGKLEEAEGLQRKALVGREAQLGAFHPHTLRSVNNLASLLESRGKLEQAEPLYRRCLAGLEAQLGADHPGTLTAVNNLALLLKRRGKLEEAECLHRRALQGGESQLGPQHPDTLLWVNNLANLLRKQGKLNEAEELYRRALKGFEDLRGPMHLDTLIPVRGLAVLLEAKSSFAEAGQLYLRELRALEELHGPEHTETEATRRNLERFQRKVQWLEGHHVSGCGLTS
eukprot:s1011_g22.t1